MAYLSDNERPDFEKMPDGLVPAVIQDAHTKQALMLGYMNAEAFDVTVSSGYVTFFSRSKKRLWMKGETTGNTLKVNQILLDCDKDTILIKAVPAGPVCHTGDDTCWGEKNQSAYFLPLLEQIIHQRKTDAPDGSYTATLFAAGIPKMAQKVGEEAVETIIEALGDDRKLFLNETADLFYHLLVLMAAKDVTIHEIETVLQERQPRN